MPDPGDDRDHVADLRGHIDAAHAAADKLVREAAERAAAADRAFRERIGDVPERGWAVAEEHEPGPGGPSELQLVVRLLESLREVIPAELSAQLAEAVRELLLAVRALIDWYLDRLERGAAGQGRGGDDDVEEIPIS
ncbi:MAG: hypothetical protein QOE86_2951 [Solirubrobacteraceae bacterium]|nr:hypothetical protein [Solirubrobacteraceae bacterium]